MFADRVLVQQILWNLLVNSLQAMDHPGTIIIHSGKRGPLKPSAEDSTLLYHENCLESEMTRSSFMMLIRLKHQALIFVSGMSFLLPIRVRELTHR